MIFSFWIWVLVGIDLDIKNCSESPVQRLNPFFSSENYSILSSFHLKVKPCLVAKKIEDKGLKWILFPSRKHMVSVFCRKIKVSKNTYLCWDGHIWNSVLIS